MPEDSRREKLWDTNVRCAERESGELLPGSLTALLIAAAIRVLVFVYLIPNL